MQVVKLSILLVLSNISTVPSVIVVIFWVCQCSGVAGGGALGAGLTNITIGIVLRLLICKIQTDSSDCFRNNLI